CQPLQTTANQIGTNWVHKYRQRDVEYDRHTDHGRKEGVMLTN
ncbi:MAG: DUF922 domain-containing protein, partial [Synechocystis sp.]